MKDVKSKLKSKSIFQNYKNTTAKSNKKKEAYPNNYLKKESLNKKISF